MYVCNCNGLTARQIDAAIRDGASGWQDVYARCDTEPQCGKCIPDICRRLNGDTAGAAPVLATPKLQGA